MSSNSPSGKLYYARPEEDVVVLRVVGRGNLELSPTLKNLTDRINRYDYSPRYVIDLAECSSLDSTFMGALASIGLHQNTCRKDKTTIVNANDTTRRQLTMLGLSFLLDIRSRATGEEKVGREEEMASDLDYDMAESSQQSRFDRIVHMIESHEALIDACSGNEVKFRTVLDTLNESLAMEDQQHHRNDSENDED